MICITRDLYGCSITAWVTLFPQDIHVLLAGGQLPHTGAVSMYRNGIAEGVIQPEGHRERALTDWWAKVLSREFTGRATVVSGVHYDNARPDQIAAIVSVTEDMLAEALSCIGKIKKEEKEDGQGE